MPQRPEGLRDNYIIPITQLSHITHDEEARQIQQGPLFEFKPNAKFGRDWSIGKTFKKNGDDSYERISTAEKVFPGYLSWWGISLREWYKKDYREKFGVCCDCCIDLDPHYGDMCAPNHIYKPGYLNNPPDSTYGDKEFTVSWSGIMESYKQSRTDCVEKDVYFFKAGTLRYRCEICYVVMVAMSDDLDIKVPGISQSEEDKRVIDLSLCIDSNGMLITDEQSPSFTIKHPISWIRGRGGVSWEQLVFAFYFPDNKQSLKCRKGLVIQNSVRHNTKFCAQKKCPYIP